MKDDTFTAFVIDDAFDELAPEVRELWLAWLCQQPDRLRERDEILAALEATRCGVERDSAFLHPVDEDLADVALPLPGTWSAASPPASGARVLPFPAARAPAGSLGLPLLKQVAALALLIVAAGSGYLAGSRSAPGPAPAPLAAAAPYVPAAEPELEPAAPSLAGAWARYHWSLESDESTISLRQAPGSDPL